MLCYICHKTAVHKHHVIRLSQGGSNNPENLCPLCFNCHIIKIHSQEDKEAINKTYEYIKGNLDKCWSSKKGIKPKIIRILENDMQ